MFNRYSTVSMDNAIDGPAQAKLLQEAEDKCDRCRRLNIECTPNCLICRPCARSGTTCRWTTKEPNVPTPSKVIVQPMVAGPPPSREDELYATRDGWLENQRRREGYGRGDVQEEWNHLIRGMDV
ncbi:hypothetical protein BT69DRAFT_1285351 [Atractiella rhizophila]|nr:hypothetical protein BT69DRAFT_1285351 [Atractiella rhizophila]